MRLKQLLYLLPLALAGCVGSNTALFMTKSNAGLDLDMKPPTAEINISRKEGVVEPSFEGGQTPPVMASFSTKIGHDKMDSFFFGVNQTFAGGDAAVTMAKLYAQTNDFMVIEADGKEKNKDNLKDLFDSKLTLSEPPKANAKEGFLGWRKKLFGLAKPGEVRPFFFGTDTQFGVKVAWNGVGGPYPDTVKVGFNRKELAVAPLTINDQNEVRIPSFLATVDSSAKGAITPGTNSLGVKQDVNWLQYFATGQSADYLARQRGVRQAMLERADPKALAASKKLMPTPDQTRLSILARALVGVYEALDKLGKLPEKDNMAAAHLIELDKAAPSLGVPATFAAKNFIRYNYDPATLVLTKAPEPGNPPFDAGPQPFIGAIRYWNALGASVHASSLAVAGGAAVQLGGANITAAESTLLSTQLQLQKKALEELEQKFSASDAVINAMTYYGQLVNPK